GVTGTGAFLGTIDYVAPEQARAERVDARTDVYSLGCVLFHALTGSVPFPLESDLAKLYAHGTQPPPSIRDRSPDVPAAFDPVLMRAMAKAPDDRYLSAGDLGRAAVAAAANASTPRAETSVAVGPAAPLAATAVPLRERSPAPAAAGSEPSPAAATAPGPGGAPPAAGAPTPAAPADPSVARVPGAERAPPRSVDPDPGPPGARPPGRRRLGPILAGVALAVAAVVVLVVVLVGGSGGGGSTPAPTPAPPAAPVGLVLGRSIPPVSLGQTAAAAGRSLAAAGYALKPDPAATPGSDREFVGRGGSIVLGYETGRVTQIHKYNDSSIRIGAASVDSTLRQARAALPGWREIACPRVMRSLFGAPDGHTYFEYPLGLDVGNDGSNGVVVSRTPVDRSFCG
ncbi:MAG: eukaryotic-like serine/threonine-protein kinase, partial [Solirubrobacteraceae bacterium]|nr:eukaryotic-like serine/threonine-protein kinase [Solirubrobacteraceae bacterium]